MIALTTPTGNIGSKVLRRLLESSQEPLRVIVRDAAKLAPEAKGRVEIVEGSLYDDATLDRAFTEARAVFWCQPDPSTAPDYQKAYEDLSQAGSAAIRRAGVQQVVAIATAGETPDRPAGPLTALRRMEAIFGKNSGAGARFLRCGSFYENMFWQWDQIMNEGFFAHALSGGTPGPHVTTQDIAAAAATFLTDKDWSGVEAVPLVGPEELSYNDIARNISAHLGKPVRYLAMPGDAYRDLMISLGQSPSAAQGLVDMLSFLERGYRPEPHASRTLSPTTFPQWLKQNVHLES